VEQTFAEFALAPLLTEELHARGIKEPTPVQREAIPAILAGKDVLVQSPTGSGKTLAYLLPICTRLQQGQKEIQALILAPTHELVMQICREAESLLEKLGMHAVPLIGGVDPKRQLEKLKSHPQVVVGTPGRVKELLDLRKLKVHAVKTVVVDEADRMMDAGFAALTMDVMKRTMRDTQRLFFSATLPEEAVAQMKTIAREPVLIRAEAPPSKAEVLHFYLVSEGRKKVDTLRRLLRLVNARSTIVFVNTLDKVDEIVAKLTYHHLPCRLLHREEHKLERAETLRLFREGELPVLIATDVAARGLDIPGVECVVHFDPATDAESYLHRSGRTGRMGAAGLVFSIITPQERFILDKFSRRTGIALTEKAMSHGALVNPEELRAERKRIKPGIKLAETSRPHGRASRGTGRPFGAKARPRRHT